MKKIAIIILLGCFLSSLSFAKEEFPSCSSLDILSDEETQEILLAPYEGDDYMALLKALRTLKLQVTSLVLYGKSLGIFGVNVAKKGSKKEEEYKKKKKEEEKQEKEREENEKDDQKKKRALEYLQKYREEVNNLERSQFESDAEHEKYLRDHCRMGKYYNYEELYEKCIEKKEKDGRYTRESYQEDLENLKDKEVEKRLKASLRFPSWKVDRGKSFMKYFITTYHKIKKEFPEKSYEIAVSGEAMNYLFDQCLSGNIP